MYIYAYCVFYIYYIPPPPVDFRWFCHVDDDNYVNVPALDELLKSYNPIGDWYLGRTSTPNPLQIRTKSQVSFNRFFQIEIIITE